MTADRRFPARPATAADGFSAPGRALLDEDEISLSTVGVDIGSTTSHLVFSMLRLTRDGSRYVVAERAVRYESSVILTPYSGGQALDAAALGDFINSEYAAAGMRRDDVDTGALILTGLAARRENAQAVGTIFAAEAGQFVSVTAGDALEATISAHGSGAVARSRNGPATVLNIDIGGGTTKFAVCSAGSVTAVTALDVGARLLTFDPSGVVTGIEDAGRRLAASAAVDVRLGRALDDDDLTRLGAAAAELIMDVVRHRTDPRGGAGLLRLPPLSDDKPIDEVIFSGGVAEFIHGRETRSFGDLGPWLAEALATLIERDGVRVGPGGRGGIRATVLGAGQYTVQVSGNTIYIDPADTVPIRGAPVLAPDLGLAEGPVDRSAVATRVASCIDRFGLTVGEEPVALRVQWQGSATYQRLHDLCAGILDGLSAALSPGRPIVVVSDADVAGLIGLHLRKVLDISNPIVSVDCVALEDFDYIDIGSFLRAAGSVPVTIKSLAFPSL